MDLEFDPQFVRIIMLNIALISPEIPQNTGNIIRLCANTGVNLHLVKPLGFSLDNSSLRRASLDYRDIANVILYESIEAFLDVFDASEVYGAVSDGSVLYTDPTYHKNDTVLFGSESIGLSADVVSELNPNKVVRIPMKPSNRSINLSNAVSVIVFEMWRQLGFDGQNTVLSNEQDYFS